MIIEIALGIVLGVILLCLLPFMLVAGFYLLLAGLAILALVALLAFLPMIPNGVYVFVGAMVFGAWAIVAILRVVGRAKRGEIDWQKVRRTAVRWACVWVGVPLILVDIAIVSGPTTHVGSLSPTPAWIWGASIAAILSAALPIVIYIERPFRNITKDDAVLLIAGAVIAAAIAVPFAAFMETPNPPRPTAKVQTAPPPRARIDVGCVSAPTSRSWNECDPIAIQRN
jgi:hypothetical protein